MWFIMSNFSEKIKSAFLPLSLFVCVCVCVVRALPLLTQVCCGHLISQQRGPPGDRYCYLLLVQQSALNTPVQFKYQPECRAHNPSIDGKVWSQTALESWYKCLYLSFFGLFLWNQMKKSVNQYQGATENRTIMLSLLLLVQLPFILTDLMAEIWEHGNIAKKKPNKVWNNPPG